MKDAGLEYRRTNSDRLLRGSWTKHQFGGVQIGVGNHRKLIGNNRESIGKSFFVVLNLHFGNY